MRLSTGAWHDPETRDEDKPLCVHGNPNVLTRDIGTSPPAQGCSGRLAVVQMERVTGHLRPIQAFRDQTPDTRINRFQPPKVLVPSRSISRTRSISQLR